jgi:hypothetical protein
VNRARIGSFEEQAAEFGGDGRRVDSDEAVLVAAEHPVSRSCEWEDRSDDDGDSANKLTSDPPERGSAKPDDGDNQSWKRVGSSRRHSTAGPISTIAFPESRRDSSRAKGVASSERSSAAASKGLLGSSAADTSAPEQPDPDYDKEIDGGGDGGSSDGNDSRDDEVHVMPLHYANHPFASISRALQENVLAVHAKIQTSLRSSIDNEKDKKSDEKPGGEALSRAIGARSSTRSFSWRRRRSSWSSRPWGRRAPPPPP